MNAPRQPALQRLGVVVELPGLLTEHGLDAGEIFASAGLGQPPRSADDKLPFIDTVQLLEKSAALTGCPHFGLLLGQRFQLAHHGPIGDLMRHAPTLGHALGDFVSWQPGYSSGAIVYLHRLGEDHALGYGAMGAASRVLHDLVVAIGVRMLDQLTHGAVRPEEVHVAHRPPADRSAYARYLNVAVRFNENRVCTVLSSAALGTRLPDAYHARHQAIQAKLRETLRVAATDLASRTRQILRNLLQHGTPSMDAVAQALAMHPRTLRRHLAKEQTSFEILCNATRFDMAKELLDLTDLPVSEIGTALAYASPSVFADAFRRWSGLTPTEWRRRYGHAGPA
ncbi:MAG: AraC family transcriptional regulator ligand-binding domain-containing protein [Aestuariivirga sp.]|nr:AraC family transcriptional regulator ligand-binding domain-containing protein [Aestuariivirga sp.]